MARSWTVYVLKDPRTNEVRYVGVTHGKNRLNEHLYSAKRLRTHTACWIKSLVKAGVRPLMTVLETGSGPSWKECERFWIAAYRQQGANLTNHSDGGEGTLGWSPDEAWRKKAGLRTKRIHTGRKRSPESRQRMSEAQKALAVEERASGIFRGTFERTPETLKRMSRSQKGKRLSEETKRKIGEATHNAPPELREKWATAARQRPEAWKAWFAKIQKGQPKGLEHKAKISLALKAYWAKRKAG